MKYNIRFLYFVLIIVFSLKSNGLAQQLPASPLSYRVFTPFIFNPAVAGSKDFFSLDGIVSNYGKANSQMVSANLRLVKTGEEYFSSLGVPEFTNFGVGGYVFNDMYGSSRNLGVGATGAYHYQIDQKGLSFISAGVSAKAVFNDYAGDPDLDKAAEKTFFPNVDAGIYYYNSFLYAGISGTNLLGNPVEPDSLGYYTIPLSRQFFAHIGAKFVVSKSLNIIIEPSLIFTTNDSFSGDIADMLKPGLKVYAGNYCLGTFFDDFDKISFFLQYKYSRFYVGTFFELPYNSPFYKEPIRAEFAFGVNLSAIRSGISRAYHW